MKGCDALEALECGRILRSEFGAIRWNARRSRMEYLFEGNAPVPSCENQWSEVGMDVSFLFKYDWKVEEE